MPSTASGVKVIKPALAAEKACCDALVLQHVVDDLPGLAFGAQSVGLRHEDVVEEHLVDVPFADQRRDLLHLDAR